MLAHLADVFTVVSVGAGLWAALLWWRSGRVQVNEPPGVDLTTLEGMVDPRHNAAMREAIERTETLNSHAAVWTAASVASQAVATVLGRLVIPG